jgi:hypothetical protein
MESCEFAEQQPAHKELNAALFGARSKLFSDDAAQIDY